LKGFLSNGYSRTNPQSSSESLEVSAYYRSPTGSPWTDREKDEVFDRIKIIDQVTFEDAFQEVLGQKADFGGMRKIVVTKDDIPDHKFFNAFERAILSPLFEFDDLKGVV